MNTPIKIIFFGSPAFAGTILEHLVTKKDLYQVVGVVTNPDKPVGRHQELSESPVAQVANQYHLPVFKPAKLDDNNLAHLKLLKADIFLVAAYGKIIPESWLSAPVKKVVNLHFSLLPKYRGALCVPEALKNGDKQTGVTLMEMDRELDHGAIIAQTETEVSLTDNVASLTEKLTKIGLEILDKTLPEFARGKIETKPQNEAEATYTPSFKSHSRQAAFIDWETVRQALNSDGLTTHNLIRSLNPEPGAWTKIKSDDKVIDLKLVETSLVDDKLVIDTVQIPGRQTVNWSQFQTGHRL